MHLRPLTQHYRTSRTSASVDSTGFRVCDEYVYSVADSAPSVADSAEEKGEELVECVLTHEGDGQRRRDEV
jgi:hypothetical protein